MQFGNKTDAQLVEILESALRSVTDEAALQAIVAWAKEHELDDELIASLESK